MSIFIKDPDASVDYTIDWSGGYLSGETVTASNWSVDPAEAGGIELLADTASDTGTNVTLTGGLKGHLYRVTNRITTSAGRQDDRSLLIRIIER